MKKKMEYRVVLHFPTDYKINSMYLLGFCRYARTYGMPWKILKLLGDSASRMKTMCRCVRTWRPDAFVGDVGRADLAARAASFGIPFVNIYGGMPYPGLYQVGVDNEDIGRTAARYLHSMGFKNFAFFCTFKEGFPEGRWAGFKSFIEERKAKLFRFDMERASDGPAKYRSKFIYTFDPKLYAWLESLPRPVAIFAADDTRSSWVWEACNNIGFKVPEDVAILGVNNDTELCEQTVPPLSSIDIRCEKVGWEAAAMLRNLLDGAEIRSPLLLKSGAVVERQSTEFTAVKDKIVIAAIEYIRRKMSSSPRIDEIARHAGVSRAGLEVKFRAELGRSPFKEMRRIQMRKAKELLAETELTMKEVAELVGFKYGTQFNTEFKKNTGMTPGQFRKAT